ncbi:ribonuclease HI family protein [Arthrobacter sp. YD4]|uniref:ribonuclease HI family protein n=1 Tax=Arthrobacter sp. YD4 TaxID=3058043 RepID=UPI0025B3BD61|nr:ribonuclease HI family protein [Arthrobacter sp. YD4]MDN3937656.1 ribonuclease HI family protein [Arthrobacter sp. YD4]
MTITAAADGSALGNPGPAGWAWYVNDNCWHAGGWPHGTNNQGELMAVLDLFRSTAHLADEELHILCDSQYVINSVTKWMPGWKRKGWKKSDGKPVLNVDLLKDIDRALVGRKYRFEWVRGHAGHELNEAADDRARGAAVAYQQGVAVRQGPGFVRPGTPAAPQAAPSQSTEPATATPVAFDEPTLFGDPDGYAEPDLFSELAEQTAAAATAQEPEQIVEALERELLQPETRADLGRTGVLLHPEFTEIGSSGRLWTRDEVMMALEENPGPHAALETLAADRIGPDAVLLTYRSRTRAGTVLRSSLWVLDGHQWRLRFHQGTAEA